MLVTRERVGVPAGQDLPELVTTGAAAEFLRPVADKLGMTMDPQKVRTLIDQGTLTAYRPHGRAWHLVHKASLLAYYAVLDELLRKATEAETGSSK